MLKHFLTLLLVLTNLITIAQLKGKVVGVADGDTFTLLTEDKQQYKIRLHGIDCPEKGQDFGNVAKKFTSDCVFGKEVIVQQTDTDRYGRTVGIVFLSDSIILNELLLKEGLAWHYKRYDRNPEWSEMEHQAKTAKKGMWSHPDLQSPEDWRKSKRESQQLR